ncbi:MAG TPA: contractile injection system protein, VgrG/Pvc8 family, partial [Geobacteraceae bacterium]
MEHENLTIAVEGEELSDVYADMVSLDVELDDELAGMFRLKVAMAQNSDGTWKYLDDERFAPWKQVTVSAGYESGMDELISGYTTHIRPTFDPDPSQCELEIWGMDGSVLMDREEKLKDWPNKKDSDIATEIFSGYGLTPDVDDTAIVHDEAVSTIIQRETDMRFLKRLALRNGYEYFIEGGTGHFRLPRVGDPPQPVLAVHFGDETNVEGFSLEVNALKSAEVAMSQIDRSDKSILDASVASGSLTPLGASDAASLLPSAVDPAKVYVGMDVATGQPEMTALCQGLFDEYAWFVTGQGEISGNKYGHVLKPRKTVTIKGIGETHSGVYWVSHVTHSFTSQGY